MTEFLECNYLEVLVKAMSKGALFKLTCSKLNIDPNARSCRDCIRRGENN